MAITTRLQGGILTLTLNRPEKRNALDRATLDALHGALEQADLDAKVRVVAIRGAGKDFCAGADLDELLASADKPPAANEEAALRMGNLFLGMRALPKPVVAIVHGRALAGGAGLATACDLVLAVESAQLGYPEIQRGFVPAMVMTLLRRAVGEKLAFDLAATGRVLSASEAAAVGLVSRVYKEGEFAAGVDAVLSSLAGGSANALALTKKQFYQLDNLSLDEGIRLGAMVNALARAHPDFKQAIQSFLKK
ncbi:MAG TPA: enoyl-CoA hydratase/isomerase family protein [Gemmatimonadales bacterium]|jgi:methylglutaconyl-CoA hydratase|nr:enoyl-CoA hydratase/isomerase family protein [Gemmatimonadales bacterium]